MRRRTLLLLLLPLLIAPRAEVHAHGAAAERAFDPTGAWGGVLVGPGNALPVVVRVRSDGAGAWQGQLDIPSRGVFDAAGAFGVSRDSVRFEVRALGASFAGVRAAADTVVGTWRQAGLALPLQLVRTTADPVRRRAQEHGLHGHREQAVAFTAAEGVTLRGTLTLPASPGPYPAVVLVAGSGPQDRDASHAGHRPFLILADYLAAHGIAVLRYDERGVGASSGDFAVATTRDFAADAEAAFHFLARHRDVRGGGVGIIGHSEGGMVAPMVAARVPELAFLVLLAAPGLPLREIAVQQAAALARAEGMTEAWVATHADMVRSLIQEVTGDAEPDAARIRAILEAAHTATPWAPATRTRLIDEAVAAYTSPWARFAYRYDPAPVLRQVRAPVLALNGTLDMQVDAAANLAAINGALVAGGNPSVAAEPLAGLNHYFQTARSGALSEYAHIEETFAPAALARIAGWIAAQLPPPHHR